MPASPTVHVLTQPDGSSFEAVQWGDEWQHGLETLDGYTIVLDEERNVWVYGVLDAEGRLQGSSVLVGSGSHPPDGLVKGARPAREEEPARLSPQTGAPQGTPLRAAGTADIPVILMNFANRSTSCTIENFDRLFFATGTRSLKDYFEEVSYRKFTISPGPEGVVGWYEAARGHDYYGKNTPGAGKDAWPGDLVHEAVAKADAAGFDFSPYDRDGDCYVDLALIVHQGSGEENSNVAADIWAHRWKLSHALALGRSHYGPYVTSSCCVADPSLKVKVDDYVIGPETLKGDIGTIGVFAHELGHGIGLPDLYDTDNTPSKGVGQWSLMSSGNWNKVSRIGDRPAHPDAWSKYRLGWVVPKRVSGTLPKRSIHPAATDADVYQLLDGSPLSGEYYLVENRQRLGFDAGLPGSGLLVWHIDGRVILNGIANNTVNNNQCWPPNDCSVNHYGVGLMQADGQWHLERNLNWGDAGDPYSGSTENTLFTHDASPASDLWDGSRSGVNISAVSASKPVVTANLSVSAPIPFGPFTEYALPEGESKPYKMAAGPDGNIWYTRIGGSGFSQGRIGKVTPSGAVTEYPLAAGSWPTGITAGPDGNVWFTNPFYDFVTYTSIHKVGRITPGGAITQWTLPTANGSPFDIVTGPDKRLWTTETYGNRIARIGTGGGMAEFAVPTPTSEPSGIAIGSDGNIWFGENRGNNIGVMTPSGAVTEYPIPTPNVVPYGLALGPDGNVWFTEYNAAGIGKITPGGVITEYDVSVGSPYSITPGPDGNLWFGTYGTIARITTSGSADYWRVPNSSWAPGIAWGADGSLWFTVYDAMKVAKITFETVSTPSTPVGPAEGATGASSTYWTGNSHSNLEHDVQYRFDWDDGTDSGWLPSGTTSAAHAWSAAGTYLVRAQARCAADPAAISDVPAPLTVTVTAPQESVSIPNPPSGPSGGVTGTAYAFSTGGSSSSLGHEVQYRFDWGDGTDSGWLTPGTSSASHTWCAVGTHQVRAEARCVLHQQAVSCWSEALPLAVAPALPSLGTLTPSSAYSRVGVARTFTAVYMRACGSPNLKTAYFLVNGTQSPANGFMALYDAGTNKLKVYNDAGTGFVGECTPGIPGTLGNTRGTLNCESTLVSAVGAKMSVKWNVTPKKPFSSATPWNLYMDVKDVAGRRPGWEDKGNWKINP